MEKIQQYKIKYFDSNKKKYNIEASQKFKA